MWSPQHVHISKSNSKRKNGLISFKFDDTSDRVCSHAAHLYSSQSRKFHLIALDNLGKKFENKLYQILDLEWPSNRNILL